MLIGLGFRPLPAAGLALLGNTAPVAFGALGTPLIALARVTGLPLDKLSAMVGRQLPFFSVIVPFWMIVALSGWSGMAGVWPACLVAGVAFAVPQFLVSNYHGPWLVDVVAALVSIACTALLLRVWQPRTIWRFADDPVASHAGERPRGRDAWRAFVPWLVLSLFVFVWGLPQVKAALDHVGMLKISVPYLDKAVLRAPPVIARAKPEEASFALNYLSATGTGLILSGLVSGLLLGVAPLEIVRIFGRTLRRVRFSLLTIAAMLAIGFTTRFAGSDATMGLAFAHTGKLFPLFSALLGWLGVALTGSDTSSNVLFGNLQQITAQQVGMSPVLAAATNSSGGVMGKMIDAQSIVVAGLATGQSGGEGAILRFVFKNSLALALLVGLLVLLQAYVFPGMVP
jgi:lactate permease